MEINQNMNKALLQNYKLINELLILFFFSLFLIFLLGTYYFYDGEKKSDSLKNIRLGSCSVSLTCGLCFSVF